MHLQAQQVAKAVRQKRAADAMRHDIVRWQPHKTEVMQQPGDGMMRFQV